MLRVLHISRTAHGELGLDRWRNLRVGAAHEGFAQTQQNKRNVERKIVARVIRMVSVDLGLVRIALYSVM